MFCLKSLTWSVCTSRTAASSKPCTCARPSRPATPQHKEASNINNSCRHGLQ
ncbi:L3-51R [unidentified adenovirus]|nr:L3-51R [unidentified adenovirus]